MAAEATSRAASSRGWSRDISEVERKTGNITLSPTVHRTVLLEKATLCNPHASAERSGSCFVHLRYLSCIDLFKILEYDFGANVF